MPPTRLTCCARRARGAPHPSCLCSCRSREEASWGRHVRRNWGPGWSKRRPANGRGGGGGGGPSHRPTARAWKLTPLQRAMRGKAPCQWPGPSPCQSDRRARAWAGALSAMAPQSGVPPRGWVRPGEGATKGAGAPASTASQREPKLRRRPRTAGCGAPAAAQAARGARGTHTGARRTGPARLDTALSSKVRGQLTPQVGVGCVTLLTSARKDRRCQSGQRAIHSQSVVL